jgi:hypothetical protein
MKENVVQELHQMQPNEQTKQKMLDILKRFHSEEEMDNMDEDCKSSVLFALFSFSVDIYLCHSTSTLFIVGLFHLRTPIMDLL